MSQYGRPVADISNVGWSPTPVYAQIDEATPNDSDYVTSSSDPITSIFEVQLSELAPPDLGAHVLSVRLDKTDSGPTQPVSIALLQGDAVVASRSVDSLTTSFVTYDFTLTNAEIDLITDYSNLQLSVSVAPTGSSSSSSAGSSGSSTGSGSSSSSAHGVTGCCTVPPGQSTCSLTVSGACSCGPITLTWGGNGWGTSSMICGGSAQQASLFCNNGAWSFSIPSATGSCIAGGASGSLTDNGDGTLSTTIAGITYVFTNPCF